MTPFLILKDIIEIASLVHTQINLVKANKKKLLDLSDTINLVVSLLKGLAMLPNTEQFKESLTRLQTCLREAGIFIVATEV